MATIQIADRPVSIDGCFSTWNETDKPQVVRSEMDFGTIKVRRRTTGRIWVVEASVYLYREVYEDFWTWFRVNCQAGVLPTRVKRPDEKEVVVRFAEAPQVTFPQNDNRIFQANCKFEQMPEWVNLT